jgi:hypothetical protein
MRRLSRSSLEGLVPRGLPAGAARSARNLIGLREWSCQSAGTTKVCVGMFGFPSATAEVVHLGAQAIQRNGSRRPMSEGVSRSRILPRWFQISGLPALRPRAPISISCNVALGEPNFPDSVFYGCPQLNTRTCGSATVPLIGVSGPLA